MLLEFSFEIKSDAKQVIWGLGLKILWSWKKRLGHHWLECFLSCATGINHLAALGAENSDTPTPPPLEYWLKCEFPPLIWCASTAQFVTNSSLLSKNLWILLKFVQKTFSFFNVIACTTWLKGYQYGNRIEPSEKRLQEISIAKNWPRTGFEPAALSQIVCYNVEI